MRNRPEPVEPNSSERLDGWKEIAAYLKRDVRTVQRWEKNESLPVRRHSHETRSTVYAYGSDLDAWWNNRKEMLGLRKWTGRSFFESKRLRQAAALFFLLLLAISTWHGYRWWFSTPLDFQERDWILVADFENFTGDRLLDGTLDYALKQELNRLPHVNVIPTERVDDALRLMKKPINAPLDFANAREVCLRDGNVKALIAGRIARSGSSYLMSGTLFRPSDGAAVASHSQELASLDETWSAIRDLSQWAKESLGRKGALDPGVRERLAPVTTQSLKAVQLFSKGEVLLSRREWQAAAELLQRALAEDPEFASAHMSLAFALSRNQKLPRQEWLPHVDKAVELCDEVSEMERLRILADSHCIYGEYEKALPYLEALIQLDPDHYWGNEMLSRTYQIVGRFDAATRLAERLAELRPHNFHFNFHAGWVLITRAGDHAAAKQYLSRARELVSEEIRERRFNNVAWLENVYPALEFWWEGDARGMLDHAQTLLRQHEAQTDRAGRVLAECDATIFLALGRWNQARDLFHRSGYDRGDGFLVALHSSAVDLVKWPGGKTEPSDGFLPAFLVARQGRPDEAEAMVSRLEQSHPQIYQHYRQVLHGEVARVRGQTAEAIAAFKSALAVEWYGVPGLFFLASESLAVLLEEQGDLAGALRILEEASARETKLAQATHIAFWVRNEWLLAQLYRKTGREDDVERIKSDLRRWLAYADPDHPVLTQLEGQVDLSQATSFVEARGQGSVNTVGQVDP